MKWRTLDWIWLLVFTVFAHGMALVYNNWMMQIVSYVSTFVSIALAAVAIYISVREATKGDKVKDEIYLVMGEMREKLSQIDTKFEKIDPTVFNQNKDETIDEKLKIFKDELLETFSQKQNIDKNNAVEIIESKVEEFSDSLKTSLNIENTYDYEPKIHYQTIKRKIKEYIYRQKPGDIFTIEDVRGVFYQENDPRVKSLASSMIANYIQLGLIKRVEIGKYERCETRSNTE
jgi:hypothetical protein